MNKPKSKLDKLITLEQKATAAPWKCGRVLVNKGTTNEYLVSFTYSDNVFNGFSNLSQADNDMLIKSRNALPALLKIAKAAENLLETPFGNIANRQDIRDYCQRQDQLREALKGLE